MQVVSSQSLQSERENIRVWKKDSEGQFSVKYVYIISNR